MNVAEDDVMPSTNNPQRKETRPGDTTRTKTPEGFRNRTVEKVKPDGTRITKDKYGELHKEHRPKKV